MAYINWIDYIVFGIMFGLSVLIGVFFSCMQGKQRTISDYMFGAKKMSVFPITLSLIASHIAGTTLLGVPAEIYTHGTQYLVVGVGFVVVVFVVLHIYLPVFYELQLTSVYGYLEHRFDVKIRALTSLIFVLSIILYIPVVIYVSAVAYNQVTGRGVYYVIPVLCTLCIFYTTLGGLKAVVWTDSVQIVFTSASILTVFIWGLHQVGGINNVIKANEEGGRIEFFRMDPDPFLRNSFWTVSVGMSFLFLNYLGIHPGAIQRFVSLPDYRMAQKSLIYYVLGIGGIKVLTGLTGMLIYARYKDCDPIKAGVIKSDRYLVPYFVMDVTSTVPGVSGLFTAGIIGGALSTMSAQLNTVACTIYEDFIVKMLRIKVSESTASLIMKFTVVIVGTICVVLISVIEKLKGIVQLSISLGGITNGGILSVFTLGLCFPRANSKGAMCGLLASIGVMTWIVIGAQVAVYKNELKFTEKNFTLDGCSADMHIVNRTFSNMSELNRMNQDVYVSPNVWKIYTVSYMHYSTIGTLVGLIVGVVVSLLSPAEKKVDPKLLAPCIRKLLYPEYCKKNYSTSGGVNIEKRVSESLQDTTL